MFKYIVIICLFILFSNYIFAGTRRHDVADSRYTDYAKQYESVIKLDLCILEKDKKIHGSGSAVIIKPHWIITAGHVAELSDDLSFIFNDKLYTIDYKVIYPGFDVKNPATNNNDIAVCHIKEAVVIKNYPELYSDRLELGKVCGIVGYGITGDGNSGAKTMDSKKRAGSNIITSVNDDILICDMDKYTNSTELEFLISHGDSGGGLFIDQKLAGIHSGVIAEDKKTDSSYGDQSIHTRVSKYIEWIEKSIKEYDEKK